MNSLNGLRILNTRPKEQAKKLSQDIRHVGGAVIELPTLQIQGLANWLTLLPDLTVINTAIFTSANAVEHCFVQLKLHQISWPDSITVIAVGHASAMALAKHHIKIITTPEIEDSEHLLKLKLLQQVAQKNILLVKGEEGRTLIAETLLQKGAKLIILNVYQRILPKINPHFIKSIWRDDLVDIILLTSEQSMHNLFQLFEKDAHLWLCNKPCVVISERLALIAEKLGIKNSILSHPNGILNTLLDYVIKD